ncbi:NAD(P)/FAD-dependent oxidoreductase [Coleofasciculus sp.]|uniref:NAD(P)/FAD-dependent oxidoreductase n=1 Tax=Coleofasciculus sp. TaxID=3100458 RepID=UPI0039FAA140
MWDVVIAGSGPAGAVAALVLARTNHRVLLVDDVKSGVRKVGESLPGAARPLLRDLGLLACVENGSHLPSYGNVSAWGADKLATTDFIRDPHGLGWHLDRFEFDAALRAAAKDAGTVWCVERLHRVTPTESGWHVHLTNSATSARWLIDATGRRAIIARLQGALRHRDDSLVALCTWAVPRNTDANSQTLVESTPDGWWYTALLPDGIRVVVFHTDADTAALIRRTPAAWEAHLSRSAHVRYLLSEEMEKVNLDVVEACGARLNRFAGKNWLATGDAALSFDPLSSQGIFNALYTGMKAGQAVRAALAGDPEAIEGYKSRLEEIRAAYLRQHRLVYQAERRWVDQPFWARRQL